MAEIQENSFDWRQAIDQKRQEIDRETPKEWLIPKDILAQINDSAQSGNGNILLLDVFQRSNTLTERELAITEQFSAQELLVELRTGELTAVEVTTAFCKRAVAARQLLSCTTEVMYYKALERASQLDEHLQKTGTVVGPLHGLPISVKDAFRVKGLQTTSGYASLLANKPEDRDSAIISMLRDAGAVLYVKTNLPQTQMTADSHSFYGRTLNPVNINLTAGGSSGGEGSLVAFRGSVLGVGTDIAGSIRIPALCCGVYGFKPSSDRVPLSGDKVSDHMNGLPGIRASAGPLAHNLGDIELFLSTILSSRPENYDSTVLAVPWRQITPVTKLRIGVLPEEKVFPLHPPIRRTISNAIQALSKAGHEVIKLSPREDCSLSIANRLAFQYYILEPDRSHKFLPPGGEPRVPSVEKKSNPMFSGPFLVSQDLDDLHKIDALGELMQDYRESWRQYWIDCGIDVLISPSAQGSSVPHDTYGWPPYTQIWNVLDYPACAIPYGFVDKALDPQADPHDDFGPQPKYDAEVLHGAPCSIQVVTRRLHDEECLAAAKIIDRVLRDSVC